MVALIMVSVLFGTTEISIPDAVRAILRGLGLSTGEMTTTDRIIFDLRLPRALFAPLIGAGLGVVGVVLQTTTRNDLADPFLFGLSSGAAAGAVAVISLTGDVLGFWTLPLAAFCGGLLASTIVLGLVQTMRSNTPEKLILAGLAVSFLFSALTNYLIFAGDSRAAHSVIFWMLGGLGLARWEAFPLVFCGLGLIFGYSMFKARPLDALLSGDQTAQSLGISVKALRFKLFFVAALATSAFVSVAGVIGFIGLMVPHLARGLAGPLHRALIPTAALVGAFLLTLSDIIARLLLAPQELPVGIVTTSLGALFVCVLLLKTGGRK